MFQYSVFTNFSLKGQVMLNVQRFCFKKTRTFFPEQLFHFCGSHHICVSIRQDDRIDTYRLPSVSILYRYGLYRPSPSKQCPYKMAQSMRTTYGHHLAKSGNNNIFTGRYSPLLLKCFYTPFVQIAYLDQLAY